MTARIVIAAVAALLAMTGNTTAQMGESPAGPGEFYATIFGGYTHIDEIASFGHTTVAVLAPAVELEVDDGYFAGGTLGFVFGQPFLGFQNERIELSFSTSRFFQDERTDADGSFLVHQGTTQSGLGGPIESTQDREVYEGSISFLGDFHHAGVFSGAVGLELFLRHSSDAQHIERIAGPADSRDGDVDAWFYGAILTVQPEFGLTEFVSTVLDLGAGIYGYDADGAFDSVFGGGGPIPTVTDDASGVGFRGRALGGLKFAFGSWTATLFGGVEYWSDVPVARYAPDNGANPPTSLRNLDLWEFKAGIDFTVPFGG